MHCSYAHNTYIPIVIFTLGLSGLIIVLSHFYPWLNCIQVFCMIHTNQSDPMRMNAWESVAFYFFYLQTTIALWTLYACAMCVRNSGISKRIREKSLNDTFRINEWKWERRQQRKKNKNKWNKKYNNNKTRNKNSTTRLLAVLRIIYTII